MSHAIGSYRLQRVTEHWLKPTTVAEYHRMLDLLEDGLGDFELAELEHQHVGKWLASVSPGSAPSAHSVLGACFRWCDENGFPGLARLVPRRRPRRRRRNRALSDAEYRRLWLALGDPDVVGKTSPLSIAAIRLAMLVPLRRSEVVALAHVEVDFDRKRLLLHETKVGDQGVPLPPVAATILASLPRVNRYVFPGKEGRGHIHDTSLGHAFSRIALKAGINDELTPRSQTVSLHTLRHSWVSKAARDGIAERIVQRIVGHSTQWMTSQYTHLFARDCEKAVVAVEGAIVGNYQLGLFPEGSVR